MPGYRDSDMSDSSSDQQRERPDRRAKSVQAPSFRKKTPQEDGLWNLDEEWNIDNDTSQAPEDEPVTSESSTFPQDAAPQDAVLPETADSPSELTDSAAFSSEDESVTRVEPSYSRRRLTRNKRRNTEPQESGVLSEQMQEIPLSADEEQMESPADAPSPRSPAGLGITEDEVWSDFLSEEEVAHNGHSQASSTASVAPHSEKNDPVIKLRTDSQLEEANGPVATGATNTPEKHSDQTPQTDIAETVPEQPEDTVASGKPEDSSADAQPPASLPAAVFTRIELVASILSLACLLFGGLWALHAFRSKVQAQPNPYVQPDLPAAGNWATVASAETYWREPVTGGENADPVRKDVTMIPVIKIKLGQCASARGAIRVIFYNDKGVIAGDTVTHRFEDHRFSPSGANERSFAATTGFTNFGDQEAYRAHLVKPWTIRVYEGPDENAPSSEYRLLFSVPISTYIQ